MSALSNLPSRKLLRMVEQHEVGSELWILYKGTLLYRHWLQLHGEMAASDMHDWWVKAWRRQVDAGQQAEAHVHLEVPAEE